MSMTTTGSKPYSIIVWGATGFTGQLVVKYLSTVAGDLKWAVAGRSQPKLGKALKGAGVDVPIIVADAADEASLVSMVKQTKVIISLVGPYILYGAPLVKACAENGVHYVDLTGEAAFIADMISKHARSAVGTRALIVHSCGYDSVPSDLCAFLAVQRLKGIAGENVKVGDVVGAFKFKGGASGGTLASALAMMNGPAEDRKIAMDPYCLSPVRGAHRPKPVVITSSTFQGKRTWGCFWIMGAHNTAIVRRSWGVLESADPSSKVLSYSPTFAYNEFMIAGGPIQALLSSIAFISVLITLALFAPARWALGKYGPQPGEGPSLKVQKEGWFTTTTTAKSLDGKYEAQVVMKGKGDPGYSGTAKLITECALAIAKDYDRLPPLAKQGGPLTPATAFGHVLVERLENTGFFSFSFEDLKSK